MIFMLSKIADNFMCNLKRSDDGVQRSESTLSGLCPQREILNN
jgi:hypothetical protein